MIQHFFRRNNRALTLVSVAAIAVFLISRSREIALGVLVGGILPVIYLDTLYRNLGAATGRMAAEQVRGKLFVSFLFRYGILGAGLGGALWYSKQTFYSAVIALFIVYVSLVILMGRQMREET